jgi:RNA polymerase sigma-70 factor (ECF subfamily)
MKHLSAGRKTISFEHRLREARAGSREALGAALEACRPFLLRLADLRLPVSLRPRADPSDLVQDTFIKAVRRFAQFRGSSEAEFRAWLSGILRNEGRNLSRRDGCRRKRHVARDLPLDRHGDTRDWKEELPAAPFLPIDEVLGHEEARALDEALPHLPAMQYATILLHVWGDYPFAEVGAIIDCSPEVARKLFARAVATLTRDLESTN